SKPLPKMIAVTGGKGGTGKTTIAINLAYFLAMRGFRVLFLDCDVDAPNAAILLNADLKTIKTVESFIPSFNENCISCGECSKACLPHALLNIPEKKPLLFPEICTGCEACRIICNYKAVEPSLKVIGEIFMGKKYKIDLIVGELKVGEPKSAEVVRSTKEYAKDLINHNKYDIIIVDTAPGAHCDIIHALDGANIVISVTEPTPFGLHDLRRILELLKFIHSKPLSYVIVNRADLTREKQLFNGLVEEYHTSIIEEIPLSGEIQVSYAEGIPVLEKFPDSNIKQYFENIFNKLESFLT
ncbi:MAG: P-loop NTPase, partial [Promethearchaeota archaeon]